MQIICGQVDCVWEDKAATHRRVRALLDDTTINPGALIVLPEMFATGFSLDVAKIAERPDGLTHRFLADLARQHQAHVLGGVVTAGGDGRGRNEAVLYGPDGSERCRYCKLHPFSFGNETDFYEAGEALASFTWGPFTVSPFVCYDLRFPEIFRLAVHRGAQLMIVIANWPAPRSEHWCTLLRARAIENQSYVVGVNRCGEDPNLAYRGDSVVLDPQGQVLAEAGNAERTLEANLALEPLMAYRKQFSALDDRRLKFLPTDAPC